MDLQLDGRVALITGGARGIGFAEARFLGREGARLVIVDRDPDAAQAAVVALEDEGLEAVSIPADACNEEQVKHVCNAVEQRYARLDVLVNNAGIGVNPAYRVEEMPVLAWDTMIQSHMRSTFLFSRQAIPLMRRHCFGRIINTSSMNFTGGGRPGVAHYAAAKAGIAGFTRTLAKEVAVHGITANAIAPGYVETELIGNFTTDMRDRIRSQNPVGRMCKPDEVAALVAYLSSGYAGFVNGALVCMDGGKRDFHWG